MKNCPYCNDVWTHFKMYGAVAFKGHFCFSIGKWVFWLGDHIRVEGGDK